MAADIFRRKCGRERLAIPAIAGQFFRRLKIAGWYFGESAGFDCAGAFAGIPIGNACILSPVAFRFVGR